MTTCVECGRLFQLTPKKPGFVNKCPACSPTAALLPTAAKEAALERKSNTAEMMFQNAISEKRAAERSGQKALAAELEKEIQKLGKARIT